jgi:hypothetical protein
MIHRSLTLLCALMISAAPAMAVILSGASQTPIDLAAPLPPPTASGNLSTSDLKPDAEEKVYYDKLAPEERITGSIVQPYSIANKLNKNIGWYGIIRKIEELPGGKETLLTVQHTYQDGQTDSHMMTVSFSGDGDFKARLKGTKLPLLPLRLVAVYGKVTKYDGKVPEVAADFVKEWDWRRFTFMDYGKQNSNPEWTKLNKVDMKKIYHPYPTLSYYYERLGSAPPRLFETLTPEQQLKYSKAVLTDSGRNSPLTVPENAPRFVGKTAVLALPKGDQGIPGFKKAETYLNFKNGEIGAKKWRDNGIEIFPNGTKVSIMSFTTLPSIPVAFYAVKIASGTHKDETWWFPGFSLESTP